MLMSGVVLAIGFVWSTAYGLTEKPGWPMYVGALLLAAAFASVPWLIFVTLRWLARGFRAPTPSATDAVEAMKLVDELSRRLADGTISADMVESVLGSLPPDQLLLVQKMHADSLRAIEKRREETINRGAREGKPISLEKVLKSVIEQRDKYAEPDRERIVEELDRMASGLRKKYGTEIPAEEAYKLMKDLESGPPGRG
jgi:hypothetical protein